jgi:hypothetical protein
MNINKIVTKLKEEDQDFEFYPTTDLMIDKINQDLQYGSILDIGCGSGQTLMKLKASPKYGIEKSQILLDHTNPDIIKSGKTKAEICRSFEIPRSTLNDSLKRIEF